MNPLIIKLGGTLFDSNDALDHLFSALNTFFVEYYRPLIIVHGGGCLVDNLMRKLSLPIIKNNGLRVTPSDHIVIITGALAGTANKHLLAWSKKYSINAIGLCLGDGNSVCVSPLDKNLGHVGYAEPGSPNLLNTLLNSGYLPIISSIGITKDGNIMNVNADQAATALAITLNANLIFLSDVSGILDGKGQKIKEITSNQVKQLITKGIITDGMIVKVNAAIDAAQRLKTHVDISSWRNYEDLPKLFKGHAIGTRILR